MKLKYLFLNCSEWCRIFRNTAVQEFSSICKSRVFIFLLVILPLLLFPFFCFFYNQGLLSDIPVGVYDADNSEISRAIIRAIQSSRSMEIRAVLTNQNALEEGLRKNEFQAAFYFPPDMEANIKKQKQVHPVLYKNAQNIVVSNFLFKESVLIFKSYNAGILLKKIKMSGKTELQAKSIVQPIIPDILYLYNSNFNYKNFLCPAYIYVICQMIMMLAGMFSICRQIEHRQYNRVILNAQKYPGAFIVGKMLPIVLVFSIIIYFVQFILFPAFKIYNFGSEFFLFLFTLLFLFSSLLPGFALGTILKNPLIATEAIFLVNMPTLLLSGYTFPNIPGPLKIFANLLPFIYFKNIYFKIAQMNTPISIVLPDIVALLTFVVIGFSVSLIGIVILNKQIEKKTS